MKFSISKIFISATMLIAFTFTANAQLPDASRADDSRRQDDYSDGIKETLAKQRIKSEEKKYAELVERTQEAVALGEELNKSFESAQRLTPDDAKKLDRFEKVVQKVRQELGSARDGGSDIDDTDDNAAAEKPLSLKDALSGLRADASNLLAEIKKAGRFSISVTAIENSNTLLRLVRFVRSNQN